MYKFDPIIQIMATYIFLIGYRIKHQALRLSQGRLSDSSKGPQRCAGRPMPRPLWLHLLQCPRMESLQLFPKKPIPAYWSPNPNSVPLPFPNRGLRLSQRVLKVKRKKFEGLPQENCQLFMIYSKLHIGNPFSPKTCPWTPVADFRNSHLSHTPLRQGRSPALLMFLSLLESGVGLGHRHVPLGWKDPAGVCHHHLPL